MSTNIQGWITQFLRGKSSVGKISGWRKIIFITLSLIPLFFVVTYSYVKLYKHLTAAAYDRRETVAFLAAQTIEEKLNTLVSVEKELASRPIFCDMIAHEKWKDAIQRIKSVPQDIPGINRIFLTNLKGTLMADFPSVPELEGKNLSQQDWYVGIRHKWKPYVSEIYAETQTPGCNVVAVAVPVRSADKEVIAILVMQVSVNRLLSWMRFIDIGPRGFVYAVDQYGRLVYHPRFHPEKEIVDFSKSPAVAKAIEGNNGVEIFFNPIEKEERLSAYEPVYKYGWAVVAQQPTSTAFSFRNRNLRNIATVYWIVFIIGSALAYFVILAMEVMDTHRLELQQALETLKVLKGLIPICTYCKKIRDDKGFWENVETYMRNHTEADFTHGICPDCNKKLYPKEYDQLYPDAS